jgi:proteic killer suppression protein
MLNKSQFLVDLRFRPANRLEKLKGDLNEFYSIRMNDQWRIAFRWHNGNAKKVEIIDNH